MEVMDTGCDDGDANQKLAPLSRDAIADTPVPQTGVKGTLSLRRPDPSFKPCRGLFWARFIPAPDNTEAFEVFVKVDSQASKPQVSEPENPAETAISVVLYADLKHEVTACLKTQKTGKVFCFEPTRRVS